jgi:5,10-methylenetetrahydromethanopterin reductase
MAGIGPRTLDLAGRAFDGAILHPLLTPEAVDRASSIVRAAAERAGRDPHEVEIHATVITAPDRPFDEVVGARGLGYLLVDGLGESIVAANEWDPSGLDRIREHPRIADLEYHELKSVPTAELAQISTELPAGWLTEGTAAGSNAECATRIGRYLSSGATNVILHGLDSAAIGPLTGAVANTFDGDPIHDTP